MSWKQRLKLGSTQLSMDSRPSGRARPPSRTRWETGTMSLSRNRSMTMNSMSAAFFRRAIMRRGQNGEQSNPAARVPDCASLHPGYGAGLIPAEPVVAAVFPVAAEVLVEHVHADDV